MQQGIAYPVPHFKNMKLDNTKKEAQNNNNENKPENELSGNLNENVPFQSRTYIQPQRPSFQNKRKLNLIIEFFPHMKLIKKVEENNNQDIDHKVSEINQENSHDIEMK